MNHDTTVKRPSLRYHGGKWILAPWIISHFPEHRVYTDVFGGAGSVLMRKPRSYAEIYNDKDGEIVNLFLILRERGQELLEKLELTPFSRDGYRLSFSFSQDSLEQARRTVIRSYQGFGSNSLCRKVKSGFRSNSNRSGTTPARDWRNFPEALPQIIDRLRGVVIENRHYEEILCRHDGDNTLHYCDPPYVHSTRTAWGGAGARSGYTHEMKDEEHRAMARILYSLKGKIVLSGYASDLYDRELFADWRRVQREAFADGAKNRTEVLWMNF